MSMKMVCDRCGNVKDSTDIFSNITFVKVTHGQPGEQSVQKTTLNYDICESCAAEFERFMNGCEVEEEDRYKDSKPCAVVIHKLANGNYAIENAPNKNGLHCATCAYQWDPDKCPRVKETPGTISCENDAEACDKWSAVREDKMDKEESDLSVTMTKSSSGVYMPDGKPWDKADKVCPRCCGDGYERGTDGFDIRGKCLQCKGTGRIKE